MSNVGLQELIAKVEAAGGVPTIPAIASRAMGLARDPRSSMRDIASIIADDPALASRVLRIVNSPYYGLRQKVGSLPLALTILGIREIINLVLSVTIIRMFSGVAEGRFFRREAFWQHSAATAHTAKTLAGKVGLVSLSSEAFLAGLIHDIGKIVLDQHLHNEFIRVARLSYEKKVPMCEAEEIVLGFSHPQIGAWMARRWEFPEALTAAIERHHQPQPNDDDAPLVPLVFISNIFCTRKAESPEDDTIGTELSALPAFPWLAAHGAQVLDDFGQLAETLSEEYLKVPTLLGAYQPAAAL